MNRNSRGYRTWRDIAGGVVGVLFLLRGLMEPHSRALFLLLGVGILVAVVLRRTVFREEE